MKARNTLTSLLTSTMRKCRPNAWNLKRKNSQMINDTTSLSKQKSSKTKNFKCALVS